MAVLDPLTELESAAEPDDALPNTQMTGLQTELESEADEDLHCETGPWTPGIFITELESDADEDACHIPRKRGKKRRHVTFQLESSCSDQEQKKRGRCCSTDCLARVTRADAAAARIAFKEKSLGDQRTWLMEYFRTHSSRSENESLQFSYNIGLEQVCATAWHQVVGIVRSRFYYWQKQFRDGLLYPLPANCLRKGHKINKTLNAKTELNAFARSYGDRMPDRESVNLPHGFTKREVYRRIRQDNAEVCSETHFKRIWRKEEQHITIPKVNRFSKCDVCTELKMKLGKTNDKDVRRQLIAQHQKHVEKQSSERQKYYKHIRKAKSQPEKYMSVIIDGMDQHCTSIPQLHPTPKALSYNDQLHTHITGALVHGRGQHAYIDFNEYPHDSNLTINILLNILVRYADSLPPVLYLQLDNTSRENKNRHLFSFLSLLLELNIFKKIKVGFLMVGHTHEDIDQFFSRIATHLKKRSTPSFPKLLQAIPAAFHKAHCPTTAERILHLFDVRKWLLPHQHSMCYHSKPHIFKFALHQGKATLQTKDWSTTPHWRDTTGINHILSSHPDGQPTLVEKSFADINIIHLPDKLQPYLEEVDIEAWRSLYELLTLEEEENEEDSTVRWPICDLLIMAKQPTDRPQLEEHARNTEDETFRQVHIGPKVKEQRTEVRERDMVATYLPEYSTHWPQVGCIRSVHEDKSLQIEWYTGTLTSKWKEVKVPVKGQKGRKQLWVETIDSSSVILPPFSLTAGEKLPLQTVNGLREKHSSYFQ
ncbi:uncharacterized protein LOC115924008 isoform X2 [Strongylocentrotus purpuratus]|uniref:DUF7869 domain-containing protein n=1 Tax=Strongylocentrotus purpuratus TaxID=7668 RepID=A0A7M7NTL9_STRPU|nr:uncharacterized protein LOC115924008 isoform X2 [Strongylocentrotus purpuratus]